MFVTWVFGGVLQYQFIDGDNSSWQDILKFLNQKQVAMSKIGSHQMSRFTPTTAALDVNMGEESET